MRKCNNCGGPPSIHHELESLRKWKACMLDAISEIEAEIHYSESLGGGHRIDDNMDDYREVMNIINSAMEGLEND